MWILVIVILSVTGEPTAQYKLGGPMLKHVCEEERERVAKGMEEAYPGDTDYAILCVQVKGPRLS